MVNVREEREGGVRPEIRIYNAGELRQTLFPRSTGSRPHRFDSVFQLPDPGDYRVEAHYGDAMAQTVIRIEPPLGELDEVSADPAYLQRLAEISGGHLVDEEGLNEIVERFSPRVREAEAGTVRWEPNWITPWVLLSIVCCGLLEWGLRRRNGLL